MHHRHRLGVFTVAALGGLLLASRASAVTYVAVMNGGAIRAGKVGQLARVLIHHGGSQRLATLNRSSAHSGALLGQEVVGLQGITERIPGRRRVNRAAG